MPEEGYCGSSRQWLFQRAKGAPLQSEEALLWRLLLAPREPLGALQVSYWEIYLISLSNSIFVVFYSTLGPSILITTLSTSEEEEEDGGPHTPVVITIISFS